MIRIVPDNNSIEEQWKINNAKLFQTKLMRKEKINALIHCQCSLIGYFAQTSKAGPSDSSIQTSGNSTLVSLFGKQEEN